MTGGEDVSAYYDAVAPQYARRLQDESFEAPFDLGVLDHFLALLPEDAFVLDAGCGAGRMVDRIRRPGGRRVEGVDGSEGMLAQARARHPDVAFHVGDLRALPYEDDVADGVLEWYSLIHLEADGVRAAVAEAARVLRPGGLVLIAFQAGSGTRSTTGHGQDVSVRAVLHEVDGVVGTLGPAGLAVVATARRDARPGERWPQGFLLGRRNGALSLL